MLHTWLKRNNGDGSPALANAEAIVGSPVVELPESSGAGLLVRLRQADTSAVLELYDLYQAPIYQYVLEMTGDPSLAGDVTQDVFLLMLGRGGSGNRIFSRFDPDKGNLEGYLLGVARRLTRKLKIRESRWMPIDPGRDVPDSSGNKFESQFESHLSLMRLRSAIRLLPLKYREVIVLCCLQEQSYEQAAAILDCSVGTVASRLSRARKLLSARLAGSSREEKHMVRAIREEIER